jgi:hypothetical protein
VDRDSADQRWREEQKDRELSEDGFQNNWDLPNGFQPIFAPVYYLKKSLKNIQKVSIIL